jgi:GT2 family glycosyltransferase
MMHSPARLDAARHSPPRPGPLPMVSVVIPCRNERRHIRGCLDTLLAGDYPAGSLEILVIDGMSDDGTREILAGYARSRPELRLVDNPARTTPAALNLGIAHARGSIFVRADAHAAFPRCYVRDLVESLMSAGADGVGGVCRTVPGAPTTLARAIATALAHPFGVGNSYFRIGTDRPRWVETIPFGCYPMDLFRRIGGFDEALLRNQDDEFNYRVIGAGGRLLLVPHVVTRYFGRTRLRDVARMFYQYGLYKPLVIRKVGRVVTLRQLAPAGLAGVIAGSVLVLPWAAAGAVGLAATAAAYLAVACVAAAGTARSSGVPCALALMAVFPVMHLAYGVGFLAGLPRLAVQAGTPAAADAALSR